jgi:urease accessory protein
MEAHLARNAAPGPALEKARGEAALTVSLRDGMDAIRDLRQSGCGRLLFPHRPREAPLEAVLVNTAGGLTGGDRFRASATVGEGARAVVTTQACEKIYRSGGGVAEVRATLSVAAGASLQWLPQETILFEGSALRRSLVADVAPEGRLLAAESVILGRAAMGETVASASFRDSWRIRRGGRLIFAEETAVGAGEWARARSSRAALGADASAFATLLLAASDAAGRLDPVRSILDSQGIDGGASLVDGLLVVLLMAGPGLAMRKAMIPLIECLSGAPPPRVWTT